MSILIKLNVTAAVYRDRSVLRDYPILEVVGVTAITGCISYLVFSLFLVQRLSAELTRAQDCLLKVN